ncbi:MAG TPA: thioredoxin family protein [Cyclobacteriaceae bacterium]|nr:thioredoxin family protein [Cyclobacteriaceae bacterium]
MNKLLLGLVAVFLLAASAPVNNGLEVGDKAPDFKLKNVDGKMVSMADYTSAKGFIVIFDCNTCPYSKAYNDRIKALHANYASKGFPLILIQPNDPVKSPGDSYEEMQKYAKEKGYNFPYLIDETQETTRAYGATNTPHVFVLSKQGADLRVAYIGAIDNNTQSAERADKKYVDDALNALLGGKDVPVNKTKAIGCTIKWRSV